MGLLRTKKKISGQYGKGEGGSYIEQKTYAPKVEANLGKTSDKVPPCRGEHASPKKLMKGACRVKKKFFFNRENKPFLLIMVLGGVCGR